MTGRWRWGGILAVAGLAVALSGCGQLFTQGSQPATLAELSSRVDSLDAQVGQLQAVVAGGGQASTSTVPPGLASAMVEAGVLNVREDPSLQGTIRGTLLQNAVVGILRVDGNWTEITYTNPTTHVTLTGWVDSDYLGPVMPTTSPAASGTGSASGATAAAPPSGAGMSSGSAAAAAAPASGTTAGSGTAAMTSTY